MGTVELQKNKTEKGSNRMRKRARRKNRLRKGSCPWALRFKLRPKTWPIEVRCRPGFKFQR